MIAEYLQEFPEHILLVGELLYYYYFVDIRGLVIDHVWTRSVVRISRRSSEPARAPSAIGERGEENRRSRDRSPSGPLVLLSLLLLDPRDILTTLLLLSSSS